MELGEREQEKFTGEWVDATRPSNRRLDYSAQHIGCECVYMCVRFSSCILLLSPEYRLSLYPPPFRSLSPSFLTQSVARFFLLPHSVPEEHRSRSLALAWIACVNAYPMGNELAVISILERLAPPRRRVAVATRWRDPRWGCPCKDAGRAIIYLLPTYLPPASNN